MKYLVTLILLVSSGSLYAEDYTIKICNVQAQSYSNSVYIEPCENWASKNNCPNGDWITWDASAFQGQAMYSSAMAALLADKKVTVRLDGSTCEAFDVTTMIRLSNKS
jgi:hypothetical protein